MVPKVLDEYAQFGSQYEMDVTYTINLDLEQIAEQEKLSEINSMHYELKKIEEARRKKAEDSVTKML